MSYTGGQHGALTCKIDRKTNTGICYLCGGTVVMKRKTMTAKNRAESEQLLGMEFECCSCGTEYNAEIEIKSREIKKREVILEDRAEGIGILGNAW